MTTFVLVHGMGAGGWCWRRLSEPLRSRGHRVVTPTLTGLGERSHLARRDIDLDTHITDIVNVLVLEDLREVTLVGHSYGGAVVTGVADRQPARIKHLVYLDAFVLEDGQSIMDLQPPHRLEFYAKLLAEQEEDWLLPPNTAEFYGITDPADQKWLDGLSVPQPFGTFTQRISLNQTGSPPYTRSYIRASAFNAGPFGQFADRVRDASGWNYFEIPSGHMVMLSHADELTTLLEEIASA